MDFRRGTAEVGGVNWGWGVEDDQAGRGYVVARRDPGDGGSGRVHEHHYSGNGVWEYEGGGVADLTHMFTHLIVPSRDRKTPEKFLAETPGLDELWRTLLQLERFLDSRHRQTRHYGFDDWQKLEPEKARRLAVSLGRPGAVT